MLSSWTRVGHSSILADRHQTRPSPLPVTMNRRSKACLSVSIVATALLTLVSLLSSKDVQPASSLVQVVPAVRTERELELEVEKTRDRGQADDTWRDAVDDIEHVLLFIGYAHSGHSILGNMIDAHPNIVLSSSYYLLSEWEKIKARVGGDKYGMCREMYRSSVGRAGNKKYVNKKGYNLQIPSLWQGNFTKLKVIGDKSAARFSLDYDGNWLQVAADRLGDIENFFNVPIKIIHLIRNPFDMIATHGVFNANQSLLAKNRWQHEQKISLPVSEFEAIVELYHAKASAAMLISRHLGGKYSILELHHADFVHNSKSVLLQICDFLDLECPAHYLEVCYNATFKTLSKSRYLLEWPPEAVTAVEELIKEFPFFARYSFDGDQ